jgi:demethylmenaquinone methyltransferase/2-methoxy-6-polyprenyl-1,4-benzoquinol methylase
MAHDRTRTSLERAFDSPAAKRRHVRRLFATIAARYDLITRLLSFGLDQRWKRQLFKLSGIGPGYRVLDLACGTGDLALGAVERGAVVVALDLAEPMVELAKRKPGAAGVSWLVGDMTDLPVASRTFDVVTTGYGLRNVPDLPRALAEIHRVLRPGGVFCSLDFNRPAWAPVRLAFLGWLTGVGATLGWLLHRDPDTYRYIPESIRRYPGATAVTALISAADFSEARDIRVLGGLMAIHIARK